MNAAPGFPEAPAADIAPEVDPALGVRRFAPEDRGLVERPVLAPHLRYRVVADGKIVIASDRTGAVLEGRCLPDLMPLLDGERTRHAILAELAGRHEALEVQTALVRLAADGYVVSAEFGLDRPLAAFWSGLGASPRFAEARLAATPVRVRGDDGRLRARLRDFGVQSGAGPGSLEVALTAGYARGGGDASARSVRGAGAWTLVQTSGSAPVFGPVFGPEGGGACWTCIARRMEGARGFESFLRRTRNGDPGVREGRPGPAVVHGMAALEIARWIVLRKGAPLHDHLFSFDVATSGLRTHGAPRRPQCAECGPADAADAFRADRPPEPLRLESSPKALTNSGGTRTAAPEDTVRRYRHLVDPVVGVVKELSRVSASGDSWRHVYLASQAAVEGPSDLRGLRTARRGRSSGKGGAPEQAEASALCEALERYSGTLQGGEIRQRRRFTDFQAGEAIAPNDVQLFSQAQLEAAPGDYPVPTVIPPAPFEPDAAIDWTPVWSLTARRHRYLPTALLYFMPVVPGAPNQFVADSNGCAAGNTREEAILQGFFELVERDAFACWWYNRIPMPAVDLASFGRDYLARAPAEYAKDGREMWLLDITHDFGIPVFVAVSRRASGPAEQILFGAGAHLDPVVAAMRAVCEMNQMLVRLGPDLPVSGHDHDGPRLEWLRTATTAAHPYVAPAPDEPARSAGGEAPRTSDHREDIRSCRRIVEERGMELLVLDQTRPDVGLPVVRVIVPGMRPWWARFAPGRLYDTPVSLGWRVRAASEAELNPLEPMF